MANTSEIAQKVMEFLDEQVRDLSQAEYADVLDEVGSDIDMRLECVRGEMGDDE